MIRPALSVVASALALAAVGGLALAAVQVYKNDFQRRGEIRALDLSGKGCKTTFDRGKERLGVATSGGRSRCRLRLPVQGDAPLPNHIVQVDGKVLEATPKNVRKNVYLGITVRAGEGGSYELRVFPQRGRYNLVRSPEGEGFPLVAKDGRIGGIGAKNRIRLQAIGDTVSGQINKFSLPEIADPAASELAGTRISLVLGQQGGKKAASAWFDRLSVRVPNP
jgi:hypothetical protein